jgi:hypothetical protein
MWTGAAPAARAAAQLANPPAGAPAGGSAGGGAQVVVGTGAVVAGATVVAVVVGVTVVVVLTEVVGGRFTSEVNGLTGSGSGVVEVDAVVRASVRSSPTAAPSTVSPMSATSAQVARRAERGQRAERERHLPSRPPCVHACSITGSLVAASARRSPLPSARRAAIGRKRCRGQEG